MRNFGITGVGMCMPESILTREEVRSCSVDSDTKWIYSTYAGDSQTGNIRRMSSISAVLASEEAMKNAYLASGDIDMIITATNTPDFMTFSPLSCIVKKGINAQNAICLAGCTGFTYAIVNALDYAEANMDIKSILVIGLDILPDTVGQPYMGLCLIRGCGAGAFVLREVQNPYGIKSYSI